MTRCHLSGCVGITGLALDDTLPPIRVYGGSLVSHSMTRCYLPGCLRCLETQSSAHILSASISHISFSLLGIITKGGYSFRRSHFNRELIPDCWRSNRERTFVNIDLSFLGINRGLKTDDLKMSEKCNR